MSGSFVAKVVFAVLAGGFLLGSSPRAEAARQCEWVGSPPACVPECPRGWVYGKEQQQGGCLTGFQILCCEPEGSSSPVDAVAPCHKQCAPLLTAVKPQEEARRVYGNCRAMCDRKGTVTCSHGTTKSWDNPKCSKDE